MKFINSDIGVDNAIILNDINYASIPGPSFTPGIGGTYKQQPPPHEPPTKSVPQWDRKREDVGCELARSAGWGTPSWCTPKTETCSLERPLYPERIIDPGRLDYLVAAVQEKKQLQEASMGYQLKKHKTSIVIIIAVLCILGLWGQE